MQNTRIQKGNCQYILCSVAELIFQFYLYQVSSWEGREEERKGGRKDRLQMLLVSYWKTNLNFCCRFSRGSKITLDSQSLLADIPQTHHWSLEVNLPTAVQTHYAHSNLCAFNPELRYKMLFQHPCTTHIIRHSSRSTSQPMFFFQSHPTKLEFTGFSFF